MKFISLNNSFMCSKGCLLFSITVLLSLIALGFNILFLNSLLLGVIIAPVYLFIVSLFCGNIFFPRESQWFRVFYGFIVFFCLLVILGTIAYLIHDLSNLPILTILFVLTISLILLNWKRRPILSLAGIKLKERITELNLGILDLLFLSMLGLSYYFLFAARTGESVPPIWNLVPSQFFVCLFLATAALLIKIWRGKSPSGILLFYVVLLILIPACGLLILMQHPYDMKNASVLNMDWMITQLGNFVSHPSQQEAATSIIGKNILQIGLTVGDVFLIKLFQFTPLKFALFFIPTLSTFMVVLAVFNLMGSLAPGQKRLALLCSLSFLSTQHNIFLFTPPGNNATFALGLLMVNMMLWVKFLNGQRFRFAAFTVPVLLTAAISLIHQYVGLFALFLALLALTVFLMKPFRGGLPRLLSWLGLTIGFMFIWIYGYLYLHSFTSYLVGGLSAGAAGVDIHQFTLSRFVETVAPPLWSKEGLGVFQNIFYSFINNSAYVTYALIILGAIAAFRYRLNKNWLAMALLLALLGFGYFAIVGNFHPFAETYRYFYYFNFIAFPLIGVGLYWLTSYAVELKAWIYTKSEEKKRLISLKPLQLVICVLLLTSLFTSSIWGGYPRPDSMGPYRYPSWATWYPSDYDFAALNFIKAKEGFEPYSGEDESYKDFFIVGDHSTSAAGILTLGYQVLSPDMGYQSIFTFYVGRFGGDEFFTLAAYDPLEYLVEGTDYTNRLTNKTYLIFTYRLGIDRLESVVRTYSEYLGKPVYAIEDKIYVFSYDRKQIAALSKDTEMGFILFDDEKVNDGFWLTESGGSGNLGITIRDNYDIKKSGDSSLEVIHTEGKQNYVALSHIWEAPFDFSEQKYLLLFAYGHNSGRRLIINLMAPSITDYFYYDEILDNFEGWRLLIIPLESCGILGTPSWSTVKGMRFFFYASTWFPGKELYLDRISIVKDLTLQQLYKELIILLP